MLQLETLSHRFEQALLAVDRVTARSIVARAGADLPPLEIVEGLVAPALERIGEGWEAGTVALAQVYMSGRICEELVDSLLPPAGQDRGTQPRMAIAVLADHHRLGKRIVYSVLRASGVDLLDYGHGVSAEALAQRAADHGIRILLVSTLMLPSALKVKTLRRELDRLGSKAKIVVGGAPFRFDAHLWKEVGADAVGTNAVDAVAIVREMAEEAP